VTPRYLGSLVRGMLSLNNLTGFTGPQRWVRRLENKVTVDFWVLIWILHFRSHGSRRAIAVFSFLTARSTLPDLTLIHASSAYSYMVSARLGSVVINGKSLIKTLRDTGYL
jgi:hypothetical protein